MKRFTLRCFAATTMLGVTLLPSALGATPPKTADTAAIIDPQAMALLKTSAGAMLGLKTYQARCDTRLFFPAHAGKPAHERREQAWLAAVKPNKMHYESWDLRRDAKTGRWSRPPKEFGITFVCDGKTDWKQFGSVWRTDGRTQPRMLGTILEPWGGFYATDGSPYYLIAEFAKDGELKDLRRAGAEAVDGVPCDKVFAHVLTSDGGESLEYRETWYVAHDGLVRREVIRIVFGGGESSYTRDAVIRDIRTDRPLVARVFTYVRPPGVQSEAEAAQRQPALLAAGAAAPDFTALDAHKTPVRLSDLRGKVVVLDFWASWCGPCVASMPHTEQVAKKLQAEGLPVVVLAVDNSEERDAFLAWTSGRGSQFPALTYVHVPPKTDVSGDLFHVSEIPTQYVLDKTGIVRASFVGYDGPTDDLEHAVRAALAAPAP